MSRLAICSATAKLLQANSKLYTCVTFCNISHHLSISWAHEPTQLWICLLCWALSRAVHPTCFQVCTCWKRSESQKEMTGIYWNLWEKAETSFNTLLTVPHSISQLWLHSMSFMLGGPSWKSPCGHPKETSTCLEGCAESAVPKKNSEPLIPSSVHAFPCI